MTNLPQFENYMDSKGRNYGLNSLRFWDSSGNIFWFSYETLVAFKAPGKEVVCVENSWGPTTGKHLNAIEPNKKSRVKLSKFVKLYQEHFGFDDNVAQSLSR